MIFKELELKGAFSIKPNFFGDERGFFMETWKEKEFLEAGIETEFPQENQSRTTKKGTLRGLHYQIAPYGQAKLVRVTRGEVLDVFVDIRKDSPAFGQHIAVRISEKNRLMLFIPDGFAHGFITLTELVDFQYKVSNPYSPEHERGIIWNDPQLGIEWGIENPFLSERDKKWPLLKEVNRDEL